MAIPKGQVAEGAWRVGKLAVVSSSCGGYIRLCFFREQTEEPDPREHSVVWSSRLSHKLGALRLTPEAGIETWAWSADQHPCSSAPAVLGTDLIHEVNTESDTSGPNPGGVETAQISS